MDHCDVLIIGAGIAGVSAAYELSQSRQVVVLERESQPGYHTTGRSAAIYTKNYGSPAIRALTRASYRFFTEAQPEFADQPLLTPRGALFVAREDQLDVLDAAFAGTQSLVPTIRRIDAAETIRINPALNPEFVGGAIFEPEASDIDVHALHGGFLKGLRKRGGTIVTNADVTTTSRVGDKWIVESGAGNYSADVVINAAGAWCDVIAELAGVRPIGLQPKRRTVFTFDPPPELDISSWPLTIDLDETFYFKPDAGKILCSPADETPSAPCDAQPEEIDVAIAIDRLQTVTNLRVQTIASKWAGLRSFVADKTPVIGMDDEVEGFFWLAAQGGYGIQSSPAAGRVTASLVIDGVLPGDILETGLQEADLAPRRKQSGAP
ncbi:MAG: FAD-binding oxidoreductase [Rhodospirillaceae bacterium]|jgi:D-arginine dehydrogenase|nr:FAD-binding oxidoreductase [Rhodospirillaceae bacterium]MBT5244693.1 FAD-binding oxidoreductase [Rhodospirillaceae bacterium]MBT5562434.1 FAD-binding oxidoreductase [Rhodospirillaceae bacterium]MBT6242072.1 FAD-binding oxidoreductase [Rhodospirillaceae bacterium]MBT7137247.1 FAD-binding oxidoreductase [Rhodospirillaceae bacterium]